MAFKGAVIGAIIAGQNEPKKQDVALGALIGCAANQLAELTTQLQQLYNSHNS